MLNAITPVQISLPPEPHASAGGGFLAALDRVLADPGRLGVALGRATAQSVPGPTPIRRGEAAGIARREDDPKGLRWPEFTAAALAVAGLESPEDSSPSAAVQNAEAVAEADRSRDSAGRPATRVIDRRWGTANPPVGPPPSRATSEAHSPALSPGATPAPLSPSRSPGLRDAGEGPTATPVGTRAHSTSAASGDSSGTSSNAGARMSPVAAARPATSTGVPGTAAVASRHLVRDAGAATGPQTAPRAQLPRAFQLESDPLAAQVGKGFASLLAGDGGSVTIRLDPEALGDLTVRLSVSSGRVEATLEAATDRARQLLESSLPTLRSALEAHGLIVDRLAVRTAEPPLDRQDAEGPGVGPDPDGTGGRAEDDATGAEHPGTGGTARTSTFAAGIRAPVDHQPEAIVTPEGVGVGPGGGPTRLRLDTLA